MSTIREWLREPEKPDECIYCGIKGPLTFEYVLPRSCGGPDILDNAIRVCHSCNSSKGGRRLYEWKGLRAKDEIRRIAQGTCSREDPSKSQIRILCSGAMACRKVFCLNP